MRSVTMPPTKSPLHRLRYVVAGAGSPAALDEWRMRALRQATTVRRVLRSAGGAVGEAPTLDALAAGLAEELLITSRFIDMNPDAAATALRLAGERDSRVSRITGAAAFELDLVAGGIAALLRRSAPRRPAGAPAM